mmetsp:Transcript_93426/g.253523  ORF Transcript_93426/g.253523 Transcript_93426/m.253523 type:complete len:392 (+) Transcript_93426:591-1766(+)
MPCLGLQRRDLAKELLLLALSHEDLLLQSSFLEPGLGDLACQPRYLAGNHLTHLNALLDGFLRLRLPPLQRSPLGHASLNLGLQASICILQGGDLILESAQRAVPGGHLLHQVLPALARLHDLLRETADLSNYDTALALQGVDLLGHGADLLLEARALCPRGRELALQARLLALLAVDRLHQPGLLGPGRRDLLLERALLVLVGDHLLRDGRHLPGDEPALLLERVDLALHLGDPVGQPPGLGLGGSDAAFQAVPVALEAGDRAAKVCVLRLQLGDLLVQHCLVILGVDHLLCEVGNLPGNDLALLQQQSCLRLGLRRRLLQLPAPLAGGRELLPQLRLVGIHLGDIPLELCLLGLGGSRLLLKLRLLGLARHYLLSQALDLPCDHAPLVV